MKQEKRFVRVHTESSGFEVSSIWVDQKTGVSYFWHSSGNAGGLTPLLDREGRPVITPIAYEEA